MRRSKPHYLNKENKTELSEELKKNNTDIDKLKQIHRNIDGSSNRWKKIETLEGLYKGLAKHTEKAYQKQNPVL